MNINSTDKSEIVFSGEDTTIGTLTWNKVLKFEGCSTTSAKILLKQLKIDFNIPRTEQSHTFILTDTDKKIICEFDFFPGKVKVSGNIDKSANEFINQVKKQFKELK